MIDNKSPRVIPIAKPIIGDEETSAVQEVLLSGMLSQGKRVEEFENRFAALINSQFAIAVNNGSSALYLALLAHGVGPGDEVITTPFTFIATANAILLCGAKVIFADINPATFNIDPGYIETKITPRTKAIIPVHLYGQPCDMQAIMSIIKKHKLVLIEDAAQAHGAKFENTPVGNFGTGCFSFYSTKNMTTGEGGMVTTNVSEIASKVRLIRNHGQSQRYYHDSFGFNYRMTDISAALGIAQLSKLNAFNESRQRNAEYLTSHLLGIPGLITPVKDPRATHVFHQYCIRITKEFGLSRDNVKTKLNCLGVSADVHYPLPLHQQPVYREIGNFGNFPVAENAASEVLSLPVHPSVTPEDLDYIINSIKDIWGCRGFVDKN